MSCFAIQNVRGLSQIVSAAKEVASRSEIFIKNENEEFIKSSSTF